MNACILWIRIYIKKDCLSFTAETPDDSDIYDNYLVRIFFGYGLKEQLSPDIKNFISKTLGTKCHISLS